LAKFLSLTKVNILGGKPGLAYYIVGYTKDKLIYLDPHFVQVRDYGEEM